MMIITPQKLRMFYDSFKDEDERRLAQILSIITLIYMAGSLLLIVLDIFWGNKNLYGLLIFGVLFQITPVYFLYKRKLSTSSLILIGSYILYTTLFATMGFGIRDYVILVYPPIILFAGLTIRRNGTIISTLLVLAALTWLIVGEIFGWYSPLEISTPSMFDLGIVTLLILVSATVVGQMIEDLESKHAQTKQELHKRIIAEDNLQALIENTDGSIWSVDSQYRLIVGNSYFHRNIKAVIGRDLEPGESVLGSDFSHHSIKEWKEYYDRTLRGEKFYIELSTQLIPEHLEMEYHFSPIYDQLGQVVGATVFGRDITERRKMEQQLRISEEQNRAIVEAVPDLLFQTTQDGVILNYHAPNEMMLYLPPADFLNKKVEDILPPHVAKLVMEAIHQTIEKQQMVIFEYDLELGGEKRFFEDRVIPVHAGEMLSVVRDITERKLAEENLHKSEERFRRLSDNAPDIIFRYDLQPEKRLSYINPAVQFLTGYSPEECLADPSLMLNMAHPDDVWIMKEYLHTNQTPKEPLFMRWIGKDGQTRWMESRIVPVHDMNGKLIAVEGITRDITERKRFEEKLRESEAFIRNINNNLVSGMIYQALMKKDGSRKFTYFSDSVQRLYGITPQEGTENPSLIYDRVYEDDKARVAAEEEEANRNLTVFKTKTRMINPDGSIRWSSFVSNPTLWDDGTTCWDGIELDITELKNTEHALHQSREMYRLLAENISDVIWVLDINEMRFRYVSPSVERLRGFTVEEVMAQSLDQVLSPDSMHVLQTNLSSRVQEFLEGQRGYHVDEVEQPRKDGSTVWTEATTSFQINEATGHLEVYGVSRDITERKQAQEALREAEMRWQFALEGSGDGIWDWNAESNHVFYSRQWKSMLGYKEEEIGHSPEEWTKRIHPDDLQNVEDEIAKHFAGKSPVYISEYRILCKDGTYKWVLDRGKVVQWRKENSPLRFIGTHTDITQQKLTERQLRSQLNEIEQLQDELRQQAFHDPLTGLFNRRHLTETLDRELNRAQREEKTTSIVIMDIDLFKNINDTYGHQVGDKFLIAIAELLRKQVRGSDIACRYGGEEFLLILPGITAQDAFKRAEELREMCMNILISHDHKDLFVTLSMGVATFPTHATSVDELLTKADKALYNSKQSGRNRVTLSNK